MDRGPLHRPEKDHEAQILAFSELLAQYPEYNSAEASGSVKLVLVGGVRNDDDAQRVESLRSRAKELGISVSFWTRARFIYHKSYCGSFCRIASSSLLMRRMPLCCPGLQSLVSDSVQWLTNILA